MGTWKKTSCALLFIAALICAPALAQSPVASSGGPQEGIKVHGDWVIEVRNPDGGLAERREFKNALHSQGGIALVQLLGRQGSAGFWVIGLDEVGPNSPCAGFGSGCGIYESLAGATVVNLAGASGNLQRNILASQLQLTGSVAATAASGINTVFTIIASCPAEVAPATPCQINPNSYLFFTQTGLSAPVNVVAGQIIQVTVSFTFS